MSRKQSKLEFKSFLQRRVSAFEAKEVVRLDTMRRLYSGADGPNLGVIPEMEQLSPMVSGISTMSNEHKIYNANQNINVHGGSYMIVTRSFFTIWKEIRSMLEEIDTVVVTGHSLGGRIQCVFGGMIGRGDEC